MSERRVIENVIIENLRKTNVDPGRGALLFFFI